MTPTFNLISESWLPCINARGQMVELSLQETLSNAHELRELYDESPLVTAALHRLLLAILHRLFGPASRRDWHGLWQQGRWPAEPLEAYFTQWRDRFELFHADRPFFQAPDDRVRPKSVMHLIHSVGNNPTLFSHQNEAEGVTLTPGQAARALVTAQAFHMAGLSGLEQKFTDGTCTRGVVLLAQGDNLFETLMLNLLQYPSDEGEVMVHSQADRPAWEMDDPFEPDRTIPLGYLDYLTWQNSRILLFPDEDAGRPVVREMTIGPALRLNPDVRDPMKHYSKDEKRGYQVLRFQEDRALWRDSAALFRLSDRDHCRPPATFEWLARLVYDDYLEKRRVYRYMALGMSSRRHQAKVYFYRHERMPLPLSYLSEQTAVEHLQSALTLAESVYRQLRDALSQLAKLLIAPEADTEGGRKPDKKLDKLDKDVNSMVNHWGVLPRYWSSLETAFVELTLALPQQGQAALPSWREELRRAARQAFEQAEALVGTDVRAIKAAVRARGQLENGLRKVLDAK